MHVSRDAAGLRLDIPDVTPALAEFLESFARRRAQQRNVLNVDGPRWPTLRGVGLPELGEDWRLLPEPDLWVVHGAAMARWRARDAAPGSPELLDLKAELARRAQSPCRTCAIRCLAQRERGERGVCGASRTTRVFSFEILAEEEPGLGWSAAPRLAGCNANCVYCSRPEGIPAASGRVVTPRTVARWIDGLPDRIEAIHFIGGNVDQELAFVIETLRRVSRPRRVIWNDNATATADITIALLEGVVDVYIPDLRYGPGPCAERTGAAVMSFDTCTAAIEAQLQQDALVCVRVLALPGHIECCAKPILRWLAGRRDRLFVNMMGHGYIPLRFASRTPDLGRRLDDHERAELDAYSQELGLRRVG